MTQDHGWEGENRRVAGFVTDYLDDDLDQYTFLVAGPPAMAEGVQGALEKAGVRQVNVIVGRYSGYERMPTNPRPHQSGSTCGLARGDGRTGTTRGPSRRVGQKVVTKRTT